MSTTHPTPGPTFTDVFVRRPVLAAVLSLMILLLGFISLSFLGVRETPDVQSPVVTVTTFWPGADPAIVESDVTEVLERQLNGIEGVRTITSTSQEQSSTITVEFVLERDLEDAANDVRSRVSRARRDLPEDVDEPVVEKADANAQPVMFLRLAGEGTDLLGITEVADSLVRERLENVPGVSGVDLFGAQVYAMRIELDPVRMATRGLTLTDVVSALQANNVDLPAGRVEGASTQLTVQFSGGLQSIEDFEQLVVRGDPERLVRLRDVADIRLGAANERTAARADGVPSLSLAITPQAKANIIEVSDEVLRRIPSISADLPAGLSLDLVYDRADAVRTSIHDVELTLFVAFGLVVMVIFAFLRDVRATLVPTLAIPVSIVGTFLVLWGLGYTVNVFTLFGLVLAIGLVVDDAIVVLENIVRRVEEGESVADAALHGTRQIVFAVIATTLSLVAVFLPVIFTGGTTGKLFKEFGVTVAASVAISAVVALTLTPMLSALLVRPHARPGLLARAGEAILQGMTRAFRDTLGVVLRWPVLVVPVVLVALAGGVLGFRTLPREFFPTEDRNFFVVRTQAVEGTSFAWMDARMREVEQELVDLVPERRVMLSRVATGQGGVQAPTNSGMIMFPLKPRDQRDRSQMEIVASLKGVLGTITAFRTIPIQFPTVGRGFSSPMQFVIQHPDFATLSATLPGFVQKVREIPGLVAVNEDLKLDRPELRVTIDRDRAAELGIPLRDVARALQVLSSGVDVSQFKRGVRQYDVIVGLPADERDEPADLGALSLRARDGSMVPVSNLVRFTERAGASSRYHYNRSPSATISANLDGITLGEAINRVRAVAADNLPEGFRTALAGESKDYEESSSSLGLMFGLALALVYLLLAAQFDSFVAPISVLLAVPLALVGAFAALVATGQSLSFFAQVGMILLVGLVTKNGILIVEYARQLEGDGVPTWKAVEQATLLRFRPILMTSVATIGGAIPIALGFSGTSRIPLGVAVVGGMISATILTLYVTPIVYAALSRSRGRSAVVAALCLFVLVPDARAQETEGLTLGHALQTALEHNPDIAGAAQGVIAADADADAARAALIPSVSASAGAAWGNSSGLASDGAPGALANAAVRVDVPVLDLSGIADARAARLDAEAEQADADARTEAVFSLVATRYVALQSARAAETAAAADLEAAQRLARLAADRVELGLAPAIDRTRAELALRRAEASALAAGTAVETARLALAEALGIRLDAELPLAAPSPLTPPAAGDVPEDHPALRAARAAVDAADASRRAVAAEALPTVDAYGQVGAVTTLSATSVPVGSVGVSASVPIFEGGGHRADLRGARADLQAARLALDGELRAIEAELRTAERAVTDAARLVEVAKAARALAEEELTRAEERYRAGAAASLEVTQAQADRAEAVAADIAALGAYNLAVVRGWAARGELRTLAR